MRVRNPVRRDADAQGTLHDARKRVRMRGFPFGTFSSFNGLSFRSTTGPNAEREAPYANSPVAIGICSMRVPNPARRGAGAKGTTPDARKRVGWRCSPSGVLKLTVDHIVRKAVGAGSRKGNTATQLVARLWNLFHASRWKHAKSRAMPEIALRPASHSLRCVANRSFAKPAWRSVARSELNCAVVRLASARSIGGCSSSGSGRCA